MRQPPSSNGITGISFNPRTHAGCDKGLVARLFPLLLFQSTHPRRVRLVYQTHAVHGIVVSIHAPTQGATRLSEAHIRLSQVSIHAPTQGATIDNLIKANIIKFQSTHPRRVRLSGTVIPTSALEFQSTHPRRVRLQLAGIVPIPFVSIHAPTQGATCFSMLTFRLLRCFNPRTHAGCDFEVGGFRDYETVSIHAPTQGATSCDVKATRSGEVSIHAPTQGATLQGRAHRVTHVVSIHAPTQGATGRESLTGLSRKVSIHAPTQGATDS